MTETRWWAYLQGLMGNQTQQEAAEKIGISKSNITRWKAGARADPEFVVRVARSYETNVLKALVEAEFITEDEASLTEVAPKQDLGKVGAGELGSEVQRRLDLLEIRTRELAQENDRVVVMKVVRPEEHDGTVADWDHAQTHAADGSPDEGGTPDDYIP